MTDRPATDPACTDQIAAALSAVQAKMPNVHKGKTANVPMKGGGSYCLSPETRVLTADLHHVPLGKLGVGDQIAGFDENGPDRRWRTATILEHREVTLPCYRVTLSDGTVVTASEGHRWLVTKGESFRWVTTEALRPEPAKNPSRIIRLTGLWEQDTTWAGGYVAGAMDGEGSLCQTPSIRGRFQRHLTIAQRDNVLLRTVEAAFAGHGFDLRRTTSESGTNRNVTQLRVYGGIGEVMRALGTFQPLRLRLDLDRCGSLRALDRPSVVDVTPVGDQVVVALRTSTETLVAEGLASHNSYSYADLAAVSAAILPLLTEHGIAWSCVPREAGRGYELAGTLLHTSGQSLSGALPLHGNDPQQLGSAITYARRYLLGCLTGIVTDDDTDAGPAKGASQTRGWDGPSTATLLNQIDADGQRAGVTYEQAVAKLMTRAGVDIDGLEALDPWMVAPFAEAVKKHADKLEAEAAAADKADATGAADTADTAAGRDDPWGKS